MEQCILETFRRHKLISRVEKSGHVLTQTSPTVSFSMSGKGRTALEDSQVYGQNLQTDQYY